MLHNHFRTHVKRPPFAMAASNRREIRSDTRVSPRRHNAICRLLFVDRVQLKKKKKKEEENTKSNQRFGNLENFPIENFASKNYIEVAMFWILFFFFFFFFSIRMTYNLLIYLFTYSLISLSIYLLSLITYL